MNYLQFNDYGKFELEEQTLAEYFGEGNYVGFYKKHFLRDKFQINKDDFISGDIDTMLHAMKRLDIKYSYNDYPDMLKPYLHRNIWEDTLGNIRKKVLEEGYLKNPIFIKPKDKLKRFTGFVLETIDDLSNCKGVGNQTKIWCSEPVIFTSEFRCYYLQRLCGRSLSFGSYEENYDRKAYLKAAQYFIDNIPLEIGRGLPVACAIDFGVLSTGEIAIIEVNDFFSLGLYNGCNGSNKDYIDHYCEGLINRWEELKRR